MLQDEDTLLLDYIKDLPTFTIEVVHVSVQKREFVKVHAQTTVKGVVRLLEHKKYSALDRFVLSYSGTPLEQDEILLQDYGIEDGVHDSMQMEADRYFLDRIRIPRPHWWLWWSHSFACRVQKSLYGWYLGRTEAKTDEEGKCSCNYREICFFR